MAPQSPGENADFEAQGEAQVLVEEEPTTRVAREHRILHIREHRQAGTSLLRMQRYL